MHRNWALAGAALLAAGCDSSPTVTAENASVAEVAGKVERAGGTEAFVRPGRWESNFKMLEMSMPGAPPQVAEAMKRMNEGPGRQSFASCLTPDEAKRPKEDFFAGAGKNCRYRNFTWGGGKIDATMVCQEGSAEHTMVMQGSYTPDTYSIQMTMDAKGGPAAPAGTMHMKMQVDSRRTGECTGREEA